MSLPIETDRLRLRRYETTDLADILEYSQDADFWLARNLDWPVSEDGVRDYWEAHQHLDPADDPTWFSLVIELKSTSKVVGHVGIGVTTIGEHRQGMVGWLVGRRFQHQGVGAEAASALIAYGFESLRLHRISARTGRDNTPSWRLMERLGMRREAHFRESHIVRDEWRDEFVYALLADEWRARHRARR
jgi:RimJ/RimL family protein N-acetyltransferase